LPTFAVFLKHTPQTCPMFNPDVKAKFVAAIAKRDAVASKFGVKLLSAYGPVVEHRIFLILEAPTQQAVEGFLMEIGYAFWNDVERLTQVQAVEDVVKRLMG